MRISGRGRFLGSLNPLPDGAILRVDDARDDSFWLECRFTVAELRAALALAEEEEEPQPPPTPILCQRCGRPTKANGLDYVAHAEGGFGLRCATCDSFALIEADGVSFPAPF